MTDHFFEPGVDYDDATPYSAPEIIRTFRCVAVASMPDTGEPVAFGFMRTTAMGWGGTGMGLDHWRKGWNRTSPAPEREPSGGLKALAEANERERAKQSAMAKFAVDMDRLRQTDPGGAQWVEGVLAERRRPERDNFPDLVARLREHGLNEAADFFDSVKPVEVRGSAVGRGNAYNDPDDTPWPTLDQEPWQPCADCNDPSFCEKSTTDLCP